jgi:hypothetical protein
MNLELHPQETPVENDPWVFRDGRKSVSGEAARKGLQAGLQKIFNAPLDRNFQLNALITAGELESALADAESPASSLLSEITVALADTLLGGSPEPLRGFASRLEQISVPAKLYTSPPEGFTYYALHPLDFATLASTAVEQGKPCAVIGIRSIGTTLSAVVSEQLRRQGSVPISRITLRPVGHPYNRTIQFTGEQTRWLQQQKEISAEFVVVDEGPGRSGSTFLSVAEALGKAGIPVGKITLLGSRKPDIAELCTYNAGKRWNQFRFFEAPSSLTARFYDHFAAWGGEWRTAFLSTKANWPATWPQMERAKYLSPDKKFFFKFEGLGAYGEIAQNRARRLAKAGFSSNVQDAGGGFARYNVIKGHCLDYVDISAGALEQVAKYCAFRAIEFRERYSPEPLTQMVRFNLMQEFGMEWNGELREPARTVLVDGHMQPYEWIQGDDGRLLKTDAVGHGDDHFFPGPTSIAWDLAGAAVEWDLSRDACEFLVSRFERLSGEHVGPQLPSYLLAYAVFRASWCKMALSTVKGTEEELRLKLAYKNYRAHVFRNMGPAFTERSGAA